MKKEDLYRMALDARTRAHAPYSGYKIGAALRLRDGAVASGANMENASYGATVCAERVAIWKALSEHPQGRIDEIVVVSDAGDPWPPCGMCRQVIAEFAHPDTLVHVGNLQGLKTTYRFADLFPKAFSPEHLGKSST